MQFQIALIVLKLSISTLIIIDASNSLLKKIQWDYRGPSGEQFWDKIFSHCKGHFQSPINIEMDHIVYVPNLQLSFINYDHNLTSMRMINNGHGVMVYRPLSTSNNKNNNDNLDCFITGNALNNDIYRFRQFHFHWRNSHSAGSEHAIDGEKFTMEMHLVHQNVRYDDNEALFNRILSGDLFTVIAVFFNETDQHNEFLDPIVQNLKQVIEIDSEYELKDPIRLSDLLPKDKEVKFLRYYGSYTTPDCSEIVTWIVYPKPLDITLKQMNQFRELLSNTLHHHNGLFIDNNNNNDKNHHHNLHQLLQKGQLILHRKDNDNDNDNNNNDDDDETFGYYRHLQELGSRKVYAPLESSTFTINKQTIINQILISLILISIIT